MLPIFHYAQQYHFEGSVIAQNIHFYYEEYWIHQCLDIYYFATKI